MPQYGDAALLQELQHIFRAEDEFVRLELWQILPQHGWGYSVDDRGSVTGIKLAASSHCQQALDLILQFKYLQRLVFYVNDGTADVPRSIAYLDRLDLICLSGGFKRLPRELFESERPMLVGRLDRGEELAASVSLDHYREVIREYGEIVEEYGERFKKWRQESENDPSTQADKPERKRRRREHRVIPSNPEINTLAKRSLDLKGLFILRTDGLEDPPVEILAKGRGAVRNYFRDRVGGDLPLSEVKVLLVGNGSAGKTSLVRQLFGESFDAHESQTHGINIRSRLFGETLADTVKARFWDFGGQEIMHATHQFFLSKRSMYILVLDGRKEEDAEYWLQHIESFGGSSPVLVVLNKIDENPSFEVNRRFLATKYKGIVDFYRVSCATGVGVASVQDGIRAALSRVDILQTRWPSSWFHIKERLEALSSEYISVSEYSELCTREGITDQESQDNLVDFLHDLGVVLHFRDLQLLDTHVLEPRWVTGAVYRLITSDLLAAQKGILRLDQIGPLLDRPSIDEFKYSKDKHAYIVEIMLKFELCYRLSNESILVPDLLDVQEPALNFEYAGSLRFVLRYSYLPKSIIPRLIVRMNADIKGSNRWRTGVLLEDRLSKAVALIKADQKAKRIEVYVTGERRRDYFAVIRNVLNDINSSFEKLQVSEWVPLPDTPEVEIEYSDLVGHELWGHSEIFVGKLRRAYSVSALLNGIEEERTRREKLPSTIVNVHGDFISQSIPTALGPVAKQNVVLEAPAMTKGRHEPQVWERIVTFSTGVLFFGLVGFLAVRNQAIADPNIVVLLRVLMSLMTATFGATVPGMLRVDFSKRGLVIRATGALGLFVITYAMTPSVLHSGPR